MHQNNNHTANRPTKCRGPSEPRFHPSFPFANRIAANPAIKNHVESSSSNLPKNNLNPNANGTENNANAKTDHAKPKLHRSGTVRATHGEYHPHKNPTTTPINPPHNAPSAPSITSPNATPPKPKTTIP